MCVCVCVCVCACAGTCPMLPAMLASYPTPPRPAPQVESLAQVGVQLLLFGLGRELSVSKLRPVLRVALLGGSLQIAALMAIGGAVGGAIGGGVQQGLFVGALLSMSSTSGAIPWGLDGCKLVCLCVGVSVYMCVAVGGREWSRGKWVVASEQCGALQACCTVLLLLPLPLPQPRGATFGPSR